MRATLFVDVDGVLMARRLGVESELEGLETGFSEGIVTTDEFGEALVELPTRQTSVLSPDGKVRIFIGPSGEGKDWARAIQAEVEDQGASRIEAAVWAQNEGSIGKTVTVACLYIVAAIKQRSF